MDPDGGSGGSREAFRLGEWLVDPASCRLTRASREVALEPKVMELLVFLAECPGRVAIKSDILAMVWSDRFVVESVLTRAVSLLRGALGDNAREPTYIETIPRRGYRLIAPVEWLEPMAPVGRRASTTRRPADAAWSLQTDDGPVWLPQGATIIGRGPENDVVLPSSDVSRRHARIHVAGERATMEDLGSKNGTLVNGEPAMRPVALNDLDVIVLGTVRLIVRAATATAETETAKR